MNLHCSNASQLYLTWQEVVCHYLCVLLLLVCHSHFVQLLCYYQMNACLLVYSTCKSIHYTWCNMWCIRLCWSISAAWVYRINDALVYELSHIKQWLFRALSSPCPPPLLHPTQEEEQKALSNKITCPDLCQKVHIHNNQLVSNNCWTVQSYVLWHTLKQRALPLLLMNSH